MILHSVPRGAIGKDSVGNTVSDFTSYSALYIVQFFDLLKPHNPYEPWMPANYLFIALTGCRNVTKAENHCHCQWYSNFSENLTKRSLTKSTQTYTFDFMVSM